jgi:VCBS repeat-containing protein
MTIHLNMEDAISKAQKAEQDISKIVTINGNVVEVRLKDKGGYLYSFFNNVEATAHLDTTNNKEYFFTIDAKS